MRLAIGLLLRMLALCPLLAAPAQAETYPGRNIRVIVPFPAGGITDVGARIVSQKLGELPRHGCMDRLEVPASNKPTFAHAIGAKSREHGWHGPWTALVAALLVRPAIRSICMTS